LYVVSNKGNYYFMTTIPALIGQTASVRSAIETTHPTTLDSGRIRLGGCAPVLATPALSTKDSGRVRLGGCAPVLGA